MTNIIRRDELEKAFRESEDRFRDLVEGSIEGIMIHRDFKPLFVNSTYAEIFGFDSPEKVRALDWVLELAAPHVQARAMGYAAARLRGDDAPTDYEYEGLRNDGSTIWLDNRVRVIWWQGEPAIQSTVIDITERKRVEDALRESEERLSLAAQSAKFGAWSRRIPGDEVVWDERTEAIFGLEPGAFEGTMEAFLARVHPDDRDRITTGHRRLIEEGVPHAVDFRIAWPNEEVRHIATRASVVRGDRDSSLQIIGMLQDITEQKRLESESLRQGRLATLGQLTATVSHELRNPLGVIRTSTFLVRDNLKHDNPLVQRSLERIERNIIRCDRIIDELLDFTRITEIEAEPTAIDAWLEETLNEQALPSGVALRSEFGIRNIAVPFDHDRFRRAIVNVFDNGCQAMVGEGRKDTGSEKHTLTVRTREHDGRVEVIFEDTGLGIPPDVYERIFEPLFSTKGFGVGLGLPVVKQIMEQHGGGIEIESEEGQGTRVCLWLPTNPSTH